MNENLGNHWGILIVATLYVTPVILCAGEYFFTKRKQKAGMWILPILTLLLVFVVPLYGGIVTLMVLSIGFVTWYVQRKKQRELGKMEIEDLESKDRER